MRYFCSLPFSQNCSLVDRGKWNKMLRWESECWRWNSSWTCWVYYLKTTTKLRWKISSTASEQRRDFTFWTFDILWVKCKVNSKTRKKNLILPLGNLALGCQSNNELICWINYILKMHTAAKRANCRFCKMYHIVHKILKIDYLQGVVKTFYSFIF